MRRRGDRPRPFRRWRPVPRHVRDRQHQSAQAVPRTKWSIGRTGTIKVCAQPFKVIRCRQSCRDDPLAVAHPCLPVCV